MLKRDLESEIIPMCQADGMAISKSHFLFVLLSIGVLTCSGAYGVTGSGKFKTAAEIEEREKAGTFRYGQGPTPEERAISAELEKVGSELTGKPAPASIAQAWTMSKFPYIFPVVGGTNPEYLKANIEVGRSFHLSNCKLTL